MEASPVVESRYKIKDIPDGFCITGRDRNTTYVHFDGYVFYVNNNPEPPDTDKWYAKYGMFQCSKLINAVARNLMVDWKPPAGKALNKKGEIFHWVNKWACNRTGMALAKKIRAKQLELMAKANPLAILAQRNYYAACGNFVSTLAAPELYLDVNKYVLSDICNYRSAALTMKDVVFYVKDTHEAAWSSIIGRDFSYNWMTMYSACDKEPNTSLRKTLMNLPGGIPYGLLKNLSCMQLNRPYYTRRELIAIITAYELYEHRHQQVVERSDAEQIGRACRMVAEHLRYGKSESSLRKTRNIMGMLSYIFNYDGTHNGNIVGLASKSIRWHREQGYNTSKRYCKYTEDKPTAKPPVELPKSKNIHFLSNVAEIFAEGDSMSHCVSGYANGAVEGQSFLFHVEHMGESATVEVSSDGHVRQSRGPHNQTNKAVKWAERTLGKWGQAFPVAQSQDVNAYVPF